MVLPKCFATVMGSGTPTSNAWSTIPARKNPLEHYEGSDLRQGLKDRGYIGMSQSQILAKSDDYVSSLKAGKPAYSDTELHGVEWIPAI